MRKKITTEVFIEKARLVHGDRYDYSKVEYVSAKSKVCIICPIHGEFWQRAYNHLHGTGCAKCGFEKNAQSQKMQLTEFVRTAQEIHDSKYDYSKVKYINTDTKVCIICPIHGEFWQTPHHHIRRRQGCPICRYVQISRSNRQTIENFIYKAKLVHDDKYDYSEIEYINNRTKLCIICPIHGEFWQSPSNHLHGKGCPHCKSSILEKNVQNRLTEHNIKFIPQKRFDWLGLQSVDFFLPQHNIAIECQGEQHFKPIEHFGGEDEFKHRVGLDKNKKQLLEEHGIKLLYYTNLDGYDDFLGQELVKDEDNLVIKINQINL